MAKKKETVKKEAVKEEPKVYTVIRKFTDRYNDGKNYDVGDIYKETDPKRTKALSEKKITELNTTGEIYIALGK